MTEYTDKDISSLIRKFRENRLPKSEWTHHAHIITAFWYLRNYPAKDVMELLREAIISHNISVGTPNSDTEGYHETITRFWLWATERFISDSENTELSELCNKFINSDYSLTDYPLKYYKRETLFSIDARKSWQDPDLRPMDKLI